MKAGGKYLVLFLLAIASFACKKEVPITPGTSSGGTVFSFTGTVSVNGGSPTVVSYTAGVNNYYMYSSYAWADTVYSFIGTLHQTGGTGGNPANSIQFIINDYRQLPNGASETNISTASLTSGSYLYKDSIGGANNPNAFFIQYTPIPDPMDSTPSYTWHFGDGSTSNATNPVHKFSSSPGHLYPTWLHVSYLNGDTASILDTVGYAIQVVVTSSTSQFSDSIVYQAIPYGGSTPYTYNWKFNDLSAFPQTSSAASLLVIYNDSAPQLETTTLLVTDHVGRHTTVTYVSDPGYRASGFFNQSYVNFNASAPMPDTSNQRLALSNITIVYADNNGVTYSSANTGPQPLTSSFQITSVSPYSINENNQKTQKLQITFNCKLKSSTGSIATITGGSAIIAVAYK
jgi:hypothetical protein